MAEQQVMITLEFNHIAWLVGLFILWTSFLVGFLRSMLGRLVKEIDSKLAENNKSHKALEAEFHQLLRDLPLQYQLRDDSIREYTAINYKLDRLAERKKT